MVIRSTQFPHKRIHLGTWKSPDDHTVNKIDHILVSKIHCTSVSYSRSYRGPNGDSDHYIVKAKFREILSKVQQVKGQRNVRGI